MVHVAPLVTSSVRGPQSSFPGPRRAWRHHVYSAKSRPTAIQIYVINLAVLLHFILYRLQQDRNYYYLSYLGVYSCETWYSLQTGKGSNQMEITNSCLRNMEKSTHSFNSVARTQSVPNNVHDLASVEAAGECKFTKRTKARPEIVHPKRSSQDGTFSCDERSSSSNNSQLNCQIAFLFIHHKKMLIQSTVQLFPHFGQNCNILGFKWAHSTS